MRGLWRVAGALGLLCAMTMAAGVPAEARAGEDGTLVAGTSSTYRLEVTNKGPSTAKDVRVSDVLDPHLRFVSSTPDTCTASGATVTCVAADLPIGASATFVITVEVAADAPPGRIVANTGQVSATTPDADLADNTSTAGAGTPIVTRVNLSITKSAGRSVDAGAEIEYTINVTNRGPSYARDVTIVDELDPRLRFLSSSAGCTAAGQTVTCSLGTLPVGVTRPIRLTAVVLPGVKAEGGIPNVARVTSSTEEIDPKDNVSPSIDVFVGESADLVLGYSGPAEVVAGSVIEHVVTVRNDGPSDVPGGTVIVDLDRHLRLVTVDPPDCTASGQRVTCELAPMEAADNPPRRRAPQTITLRVRVDQHAVPGMRLRSTASVRSAVLDLILTNNDAVLPETVVGGPPDPVDPTDPGRGDDRADAKLTMGEKAEERLLPWTGASVLTPLGWGACLILVGLLALVLAGRRSSRQ